MKLLSWKDTCTSCLLKHNSQDMESTEIPSVDEWIKKINISYTHIYTQWYIIHPEKKEILPFVRKLDDPWGQYMPMKCHTYYER